MHRQRMIAGQANPSFQRMAPVLRLHFQISHGHPLAVGKETSFKLRKLCSLQMAVLHTDIRIKYGMFHRTGYMSPQRYPAARIKSRSRRQSFGLYISRFCGKFIFPSS